ncbi:hypothetical protein ACN47A_28825 [Myxococcus fulvus]|uniref:hypothetical protein n=1 Tax=Myxococcus fulvus TaxID=33 RepID=UPI003B9D727E
MGDRLLALVGPLCALRAEEQGAPVRVYRAPPGLDAVQAVWWRDTVLWDEAVDEAERPAYLLLLGDFDGASLELQQVLAAEGFPGRLTFSSDAGYEAYVDKVLRWSRAPAPIRKARALLFTAHDGTAATTVGYQALMAPCLGSLRRRQEDGGLCAEQPAEVGSSSSWSAQQLLAHAATADASVLFTMSHGLGAPRGGWGSLQEQRARQGAMSLGREGVLEASALATAPFVPGGLWFFLACFGAGTPSRSVYHPWLSRLREAGEYPGRLDRLMASLPREGAPPFVAALPQAVLANPQGPLAVIGHVDLAWTYSFQEMGRAARDRPSRFLGMLSGLVEGSRAGVGLSALLRSFVMANTELTTLYEQEELARQSGQASPVDAVALAHLWMLRHDLSGYVLLGDPAVRLPLTRSVAQAVPPSPLTSRAPVPAEDMARAVLAMLGGGESESALALRVGVPLERLQQWRRAYTEAGLAALMALRSRG